MIGCDDVQWGLAAITLSIGAIITLLVAVHGVHSTYAYCFESITMIGKVYRQCRQNGDIQRLVVAM